MKDRSLDWLRQAQDDYLFAQESLDLGHYNQICFICQQAAEKALKAVAFFRGAQYVKSHSIVLIAKDLNINSEVKQAGAILDQYYISSRYPDGLPGGAPYELFSKEQALDCLEKAKIILDKASEQFSK